MFLGCYLLYSSNYALFLVYLEAIDEVGDDVLVICNSNSLNLFPPSSIFKFNFYLNPLLFVLF